MRRTRVTAVAALGIMLLAAASAAQGPGRPWASKVPLALVKKANPVPFSKDTVAAGKIVYENTCLPCHGEAAQGDGPAAQFIVPPPKPLIVNGKVSVPDGVAFWVITNGIDGTGMASLSEAVTEAERWQVIRFLQAMANGTASTGAPAVVATPVVAPSPAAAMTGAPPAVTPAAPAATPDVAPAGAAVTPAPKPVSSPKSPAK